MHYIVRNEYIKKRLIQEIEWLKYDRPSEVIVRPYNAKRNLEQNKLFHAICREVSEKYALSHGKWFSPDVWKEMFKSLFLGATVVAMPNGMTKEVEISTTTLGVKDMSELIEKMIIYCQTEMDITIENRDEHQQKYL